MEVPNDMLFAKLANLRNELKSVEKTASLACENPGLKQARERLLAALDLCDRTRYKLGEALWNYRGYFKAEQVWMKGVKVIASAIGCSERTVHRIISDYESAAKLPTITRDAMMQQQIDPAAGKNAPLVEKLSQIPEPNTPEEAASIVATAHHDHVTRRKHEKTVGKKARTIDLEEFKESMVGRFEGYFSSVSPDVRKVQVLYVLEQIVNTLRVDIRELRQFSRPSLVPKPGVKEAA